MFEDESLVGCFFPPPFANIYILIVNMARCKDASLNCFEVVNGSWAELEALSAQKEGLVELSRTFRICKLNSCFTHNFGLRTM